MPVINFKFDKILVERKKELEPPINVDVGMKIVDIKEEDVSTGSGNVDNVLKFFYEYKADYQPSQAEITIAGSLMYIDTKDKLKEIYESWKKTKKMDTETTQIIMNNVLMRCQIKALALSQDVNLPPQIRLPLVTTKEKAKAEYTG